MPSCVSSQVLAVVAVAITVSWVGGWGGGWLLEFVSLDSLVLLV